MLSLVLIVKNEEKNLDNCLSSTVGLWDELVIVDTGSTDRTVEIAKKYTDKIHQFEWIDDFAAARNFSFSRCSCPWVMWLDADDILKENDVKIIRQEFEKIKDRSDIDYVLINYHYWVDPPTPEGIPKATQLRERIIRKEKGIWKGRCHEHIMVDWGRSYSIENAAVWHQRDAEDMVADSDRNIRIMKKLIEEDPSPRNYFYLGDEYSAHGKVEDALSSYKKANEISDNVNTSFQSAYKVGKKYHDLKNYDEAISWYKKSLQFQVEYREPLLGLALIYQEKCDYHKVVFWAKASLNISEPKNPVMIVLKDNYTWIPYDLLAKAYFKLKMYDECIGASKEVYRYSKNPGILNDIELSKIVKAEIRKRPEGVIKLNLGSGSKTIPGFINCDLFPQEGVDEVFSMDDIPYADCSVDEISTEHALEHLPRLKGEQALDEFARVLKKGGKLTLKVPDLEECCRKFLENPDLQESWYLHTIYGIQDFRDDHETPFKEDVNFGQIHYTGFTEARLRKLLTERGFVIDKLWRYDGWDTPSLGVEAHIPEVSKVDLKKVAFINNSLIPKYLSYGDYWLDAFKVTGHDVQTFRYEQVSQLSQDFDFYFFIEAGNRYNINTISDNARPRVLYTIEEESSSRFPSKTELDAFDLIITPSYERALRWKNQGRSVLVLPNNNHLDQVALLLGIDWKNFEEVCSEVWENAFKDKKPAKVDDLVSIIIPSYKNLDYLSITIDSVRKNTNNYKLFVVNSGDDNYVRNYLEQQRDIDVYDYKNKLTFSQAINIGLKHSVGDVVLLNNDTIVGPGWLDELRKSPFDISNPFSNCDAGWIHNQYPVVDNVKLVPNMKIGQVNIEALQGLSSSPFGLMEETTLGREWVAFYATYIKRKVIEKTGFLDEDFLNGGEDLDYCRRAVKQGFTCGHVFTSWVFHFGGKTRKVSEDENYERHHEEDKYNNEYAQFKNRKTIAIYTGQAWEPWTIENINTTGIGGSETCAALLAKEFVKKGYRCIIIGDCDGLEGKYDDVEYIHYTKFDSFKEANYIDYFISSRKMSPLANRIENGKNYVWSHDIFIPECRDSYPPFADKVDKFICLSPWHVNFFSEHHKVDKSQIHILGNGIDLNRYKDVDKIEKDPYKLIYSSSPDRGLIFLLQMFPGLRSEFPDLSLHVFYGFDNWKKAIKYRNNPQEIQHLENIEKLMKQDGIHYYGRVSQKRLAQEQMGSSYWVYPTNFTETYCITAIECMLANTIPVCTTLAALETTVPDGCGVKVEKPWDCSEAFLELLKNPKQQEEYRKKGREYVLNNCSWEKVAERWVELFESN
jgi:glycosyltransferase involved in cell wall biosynthesis